MAIRRSHHSAISRPPARQKPSIAAIVGFGETSRVKPIGPSSLISRGAIVAVAFRSAPAQKEMPPAPVTTSTRASSSASKRR